MKRVTDENCIKAQTCLQDIKQMQDLADFTERSEVKLQVELVGSEQAGLLLMDASAGRRVESRKES